MVTPPFRPTSFSGSQRSQSELGPVQMLTGFMQLHNLHLVKLSLFICFICFYLYLIVSFYHNIIVWNFKWNSRIVSVELLCFTFRQPTAFFYFPQWRESWRGWSFLFINSKEMLQLLKETSRNICKRDFSSVVDLVPKLPISFFLITSDISWCPESNWIFLLSSISKLE